MAYNQLYLIGIDPGLKTTGVAIYHPPTGRLRLFTGRIQDAVNFLNEMVEPSECIAIIEDPNINSLVFGAWAEMLSAGLDESTFNRLMKEAQRVGKNKAAADLIIDLMRDAGFGILTVAPSSRQRADKSNARVETLRSPTKTSVEQFGQLTGYYAESSEHARDAATLVWGRSVAWAKSQQLIEFNKSLSKIKPKSKKRWARTQK